MTWSYDPTDLDNDTASGRINVVRLLVGDTDTNDQQVQDEEITFALTQTSNNTYNAASYIAANIAAKYARKVTVELDGALRGEYGELYRHYQKLASQLRQDSQRYNGASLGLAVGGVSIATIEAVRANTDRVKPSFRRDRFRYPGKVEDFDTSYD
ncbi:MAG TPA: hypothetical protein V6D20_25385 [Candidatus Obscuribacterales bacterium]